MLIHRASNNSQFSIFQKFLAEVDHGVAHGEEADEEHGDEYQQDIGEVDADGIGIDEEIVACTQGDEPETLLQVAEQKAEDDANDGA